MAGPLVAIVTGTSSGVGLALSVRLAKRFTVFAGMRNFKGKDALMAAAQQAKVAANVRPFLVDVDDDDSVKQAFAKVVADAKRVDLLVNNAGFSVFGSIEMLDMARMKAQFETNVFGAIRCQQAVLPSMRQQRSGKIINISSVGGIWGQPFNDIYCASKFALEGLSESQAALFRTFGVRVTCVEPGAIKSAFVENAKRPDMTMVPAEYQKALAEVGAVYAQGVTGQTSDEVAEVIMTKVVDVADPPLRVQTNPAIQAVFDQQLKDTSGEAGVAMATNRFFSKL